MVWCSTLSPIEDRLHDWPLCIRIELGRQLEELLIVGGTQYCFYGHGGCNLRALLEMTYRSSNPSDK